jgi:hypothetical protein
MTMANSIDLSQSKINQYFKSLNSLEILEKKNIYLQNAFAEFSKRHYQHCTDDAVPNKIAVAFHEESNLRSGT